MHEIVRQGGRNMGRCQVPSNDRGRSPDGQGTEEAIRGGPRRGRHRGGGTIGGRLPANIRVRGDRVGRRGVPRGQDRAGG